MSIKRSTISAILLGTVVISCSPPGTFLAEAGWIEPPAEEFEPPAIVWPENPGKRGPIMPLIPSPNSMGVVDQWWTPSTGGEIVVLRRT